MAYVSWTEAFKATKLPYINQSSDVYNLDAFDDYNLFDKISEPGTTNPFFPTFKADEGYLTLTQIDQVGASQSFFRYLRFKKALSDLEWEMSMTFTPTHELNVDLRGIAIGMLSANSTADRRNSVIYFMSHSTSSLDRSRLVCTSSIAASEADIGNSLKSFVFDGAKSLNTAAKDEKITVTLRQLLCRFEVEVTNHSNGLTKRISKDMDFYSHVKPTNTCRPCIFSVGGTYVIEKFRVRSLQPENPRVMFIGDSKTVGSKTLPMKNGFAHKFKQNAPYPVSVCAGQADTTAEVNLMVPYLLERCTPRYVVLNIGRNDLTNGQLSLQTQTNYRNIVNAFSQAGVRVYHLLPIPERDVNQTALTDWIQANYSYIISIPTDFTTQDLDADGIHPNAVGHGKLYDHLRAFFLTV